MTSRAALLELLIDQGLLFHTEERPLRHPHGGHARWMLDTLRFSLTDAGARLAATALLELARPFEAAQLATYGTAGIPLMQAMVLGAKGRYRGLVIRKEVDPFGTGERIEGGIDLARPVLLVDDSISSGGSLREATRLLREAGAEVAGAVSLVRFSYPVVARLEQQLRFPVRSMFDAGRDFGARLPTAGENRSRLWDEPPWGRRAPDGLTAVELVRRVLQGFFATGKVLRPPARLARRYEARGGCFVSLRRRDDVRRQVARSGFWHFDGEPVWSVAESLVRAAWQTGLELKSSQLSHAAIAVTLCGPLEPCRVDQIDNTRFGLVAKSLERPEVVGGALPCMPGIAGDWQQFCHAAYRNARLWPREAFTLFRHTVEKEVEPGVEWEPGGVAAPVTWEHEPRRVARLLAEVRREVRSPGAGRALEVPAGPDLLFVTVHRDGEVIGCAGGHPSQALQWARLAAGRAAPRDAAVSVSLLRSRAVGDPTRVQLGQQALWVRSGKKQALLLPAVPIHHNWDKDQLVAAVLRKARLRRGGDWNIADCVSWLADGKDVRRLEGALPASAPRREGLKPLARELKGLLSGFLARIHLRRGPPVTSYHPFADELRTSVVPVWLAHLAWTKACLGMKRAAREDLSRVSGRSLGALAFRTLAELELRSRAAVPHARALEEAIDARGRIGGADEDLQAYEPGQVLLALAACARRGLVSKPQHALDCYRRWFRRERPFEAVCSLAQAYAAWGESDLSLEIAETVLPYQLPSGQLGTPGVADAPGASTATYLEGLVAGYRSARRLGEARRARRLLEAIDAAVRFLERLVYQPRDFAVLPNPRWALGGLRLSATRSDIRVDFVQHFLQALRAL